MCPTMAASPAAAGAAGSALSLAAIATPSAPFAAASSATSTPARTPDTRMTFAAPGLPLPIDRRSTALHRRESSRANGMEPRRYPAATASVMGSAAQRSTRERGIRRARRRETALIQRDPIDADRGDRVGPRGIRDTSAIGPGRAAPPRERQVRTEWTILDRRADIRQARRDYTLHGDHRIGAGRHAEPQHTRRLSLAPVRIGGADADGRENDVERGAVDRRVHRLEEHNPQL